MRREWIEIYYFPVDISIIVSPSMRREWIEITLHFCVVGNPGKVSLHAEGVD